MKTIGALMMALSLAAAAAEPSPVRKWRSSSGHETQARAIAATADAVTLELASGKKVSIPLEKLLPEDRDFVLKHFDIVPPKPTPFLPPSGPAQRLAQGPPSKSKFLAVTRSLLVSTMKGGRMAA